MAGGTIDLLLDGDEGQKMMDNLTQDEEASGSIDVPGILGRDWVLLNVEAHYAIGDPELVENGQLLAMFLPPRQRMP